MYVPDVLYSTLGDASSCHAAGILPATLNTDQHDKWGPWFSLWLHNIIAPFMGYNNCLKVWWTNKNPHLIAGYYIETV